MRYMKRRHKPAFFVWKRDTPLFPGEIGVGKFGLIHPLGPLSIEMEKGFEELTLD